MRPGDFERFLLRFTAQRRDINARSNAGQTLLATIAHHRHGAPFSKLLVSHGATH